MVLSHRGAAALLVASLGALAACASAGEGVRSPSGSAPATSAPTTASPTTTASPPGPTAVAPLTGLPLTSVEAARRPAVAVSVALGGSAPVPVGLAEADLVYQELDRPGTSRVVALYQSRDAARVGPVGPTSPADARLLRALRPVFAFAGGATGFVRQIDAEVATARNADLDASLFTGDSGGEAPYALTTSTSRLRASDPKAPAAVAGLLTFGDVAATAPSGSARSGRLSVTVTGRDPIVFGYAVGRGWTTPAGTTVANVVVQEVEYRTLTSSKGSTVQSATVVGQGRAVFGVGSWVVRGSWIRQGAATVTNYVDAAVRSVRLRPGATWVLMVPRGSTVALA